MCFYPGSGKGMDVNLVGSQRFNISEDKATISTKVMTTWGHFYSEQEFLILDQDAKDLVMSEIWFNSVMTAKMGVSLNWWISEVWGFRKKFQSSSVQSRYRP